MRASADVRQQIMPVRRRAENPFDEMVENAVIIFLLADQRDALDLPFNRATDRALQFLRGEFLLRQKILRAGGDHFHGESFVRRRTQDDDRRRAATARRAT